jgi:hypothetical protein
MNEHFAELRNKIIVEPSQAPARWQGVTSVADLAPAGSAFAFTTPPPTTIAPAPSPIPAAESSAGDAVPHDVPSVIPTPTMGDLAAPFGGLLPPSVRKPLANAGQAGPASTSPTELAAPSLLSVPAGDAIAAVQSRLQTVQSQLLSRVEQRPALPIGEPAAVSLLLGGIIGLARLLQRRSRSAHRSANPSSP